MSDEDPSHQPEHTRIIRRQPEGDMRSAPQTNIIRRHPTGPLPAADDTRTTSVWPQEAPTGYLRRATPVAIAPTEPPRPSPKAAAATAVAGILSGWATAVIATDLIAGWWRSDPLFCVAIGFLTAVSAAGLVGGLIQLLLRRRLGRLLIVVGSVIGLLIFASLFVAGAKVAPVVYAIPVLPVVTIVLALLPGTRRWA